MFSKLKEIKDLRDQAKKLQDLLADEHVETTAAWSKVKIKMSGNQEIETVEIDPEMLAVNKKSELESAIKEAVNDANKKVQKLMAEKIRKEGGFNIPGMK